MAGGFHKKKATQHRTHHSPGPSTAHAVDPGLSWNGRAPEEPDGDMSKLDTEALAHKFSTKRIQ
eukprot:9807095-Alexandrium_andersonii.AAC.1